MFRIEARQQPFGAKAIITVWASLSVFLGKLITNIYYVKLLLQPSIHQMLHMNKTFTTTINSPNVAHEQAKWPSHPYSDTVLNMVFRASSGRSMMTLTA